jgi:predicted nucleic acid-binding protein
MILLDSSIWVDHLRAAEPRVAELYRKRYIVGHPLVLGEIAMGSFNRREDLLRDLRNLPVAVVAKDEEVVDFVTRNKLFGLGIGYIDAHLLVSARLTTNTQLWTRDKRLLGAAQKLGCAMAEPVSRTN